MPRVRWAGGPGHRAANDPFQGQRLGQDGPPGDERARAPGGRHDAHAGSAASSRAGGSGTQAEAPATSAGADGTPSVGAVTQATSNQPDTDR